MSSLRNAVKRRTHKERSQPSDRQRLGLLEKHKDYVLRAKDFHKKERAIQILKEKAAFRNPDEFYFKMINSKVVDGVHRSTKIRRRHADNEILRTKNQDIRVAQRVMQSERKRAEKLTTSLHLTGHPSVNNHTYFAENRLEEHELKAALNSKGPATEGLSANFRKKQHSAKKKLQLSTGREAKMKEFVVGTQKNIMGKPKSIRMQERQK